MAAIAKRAGQEYDADEVKAVRNDFSHELFEEFLLRGELPRETTQRLRDKCQAISARALLCADDEGSIDTYDAMFTKLQPQLEEAEATARKEAEKNPNSYPVESFLKLCHAATRENLERNLKGFCLDPARDFAAFAPWYFSNLIPSCATTPRNGLPKIPASRKPN